MSIKEAKKLAKNLINFIDNSPTASYCILETEKVLQQNGFKRVEEKESWNLNKGDKFYIVRHESAMIAGIMGTKAPKEAGFRIIGSHTDSPGFKLKPKAVFKNEGYIQLGVEVYGGPLFSTWTDRDLSLAGKVVVKTENNYEIKLVAFHKPLLRIPQLAIHYNREANTGLKLNPQEHLRPIMGLTNEDVDDNLLKKLIAKELKIEEEAIINYDLELFDIQKGNLGGLNDEFIVSKGIDNKSMVHSSYEALLNSQETESTRLIALFDNEEVGSSTTNGGNSSFIKDILIRLSTSKNGSVEDYYRAVANSFFVSADGAHAAHPNYAGKFDPQNKVYLDKGPVIKINSNTNYASTAESSAVFEIACQKAGVSFQKFVNRSDIRGGGTIGSMIATNIGMRTVDVGNAMIAMHSVREICSVMDHFYMTKALTEFLNY